MKITEILNNGKMSLSFEVFPPKTDTAFESVQQATREIAKLKPSYMSITYGAGGGTSKYTLDIAEDIMKDYGVPTLAHLTCVSSSKATVQDRIFEMNKRGIKTFWLSEVIFLQKWRLMTGAAGITDMPLTLFVKLRKAALNSASAAHAIRRFTRKAPIKRRTLSTSKKRLTRAVNS